MFDQSFVIWFYAEHNDGIVSDNLFPSDRSRNG